MGFQMTLQIVLSKILGIALEKNNSVLKSDCLRQICLIVC